MSKVALAILTGILIFIAAGILATYWVGKMRREMEQKRPQVAISVGQRHLVFLANLLAILKCLGVLKYLG